MDSTDWLDKRLDPAEARFLMLTAITHHRFSSRIWGEHESGSSTPNSPRSTSSRRRRLSTTMRPGPGGAGPERAEG